jgi:hypothetical protein
MIIGYFHICQKDKWKKSFNLIWDKIESSGLLDAVYKIRIGLLVEEEKEPDLTLFKHPKCEVIFIKNSTEYERPTLLHMRFAAEKEPNAKYFYLHSKGIKWFDTKIEEIVIDWINLMLYWNIEKWKLAVSKLDNYTTYGCNFMTYHYSGNFWWSTSQHIIKLPKTIGPKYTDPEYWVLKHNLDNYYNVFSSGLEGQSHYFIRYPKKYYIN